MVRIASRFMALVLVALAPVCLLAQSDNTEPSLGDVARNMRKEKAAARPIIDNDNLSTVMSEAEANRLKGKTVFSLDNTGKDFQVSSPDATCSLSFNTHAKGLVMSPYVPQDIPADELSKLDGPAVIDGDALEISVHNATSWSVTEITVGLTILRGASPAAIARRGQSRVLSAAQVTALNVEKLSDITVLHHLKGSVEPSGTAIFREVLGSPVPIEQDWHWAIVEAKGVRANTAAPGPAQSEESAKSGKAPADTPAKTDSNPSSPN